MHAPATCITNALPPRHARIYMLAVDPLAAQIFRYCILLLQALSGPYHLPSIHSSAGFTIICFLAAELLALLHEDKGIRRYMVYMNAECIFKII